MRPNLIPSFRQTVQEMIDDPQKIKKIGMGVGYFVLSTATAFALKRSGFMQYNSPRNLPGMGVIKAATFATVYFTLGFSINVIESYINREVIQIAILKNRLGQYISTTHWKGLIGKVVRSAIVAGLYLSTDLLILSFASRTLTKTTKIACFFFHLSSSLIREYSGNGIINITNNFLQSALYSSTFFIHFLRQGTNK